MKRSILLLFIAPFILASCLGKGDRNGSESASESPVYSSTQRSLDKTSIMKGVADTLKMGRLREGEKVSYPVELTNGSDNPFVIVSIDKTCGCVDVIYPRQPVKPGESMLVEFIFDSTGLMGWTYRTVGVFTSLDTTPYTVVITADIV